LQDEGVVKKGGIGMMGAGSIAGVDLTRFHPDPDSRIELRQELGTATDSCVFLFVGRLARDKGLFDLIHAFKTLAHRESAVELWVVGPDEDGLQHDLQVASADTPAPIRWLGPSSSPEQFMSASDVLVLPSYREGFGTVVIEAAACAIPAVAYRIDGLIDAVADGQSGLLVEVGNREQLCETMHVLTSDVGLRQQLGQQARLRAERSFSSLSVTKAWLDFYHANIV
jgi:glycosyltransferase involved in cell wall biosynthesis